MKVRVESNEAAGVARRTSGRRRALRAGLPDDGRLNAMGKAVSILEIVSSARQPMTMPEIVRATGLTKPTAHRITAVLCDMGLLVRDPALGGLVAGRRLLGLALDALHGAGPRSVRHAILKSVSDQTGETCNFGVLAGAEVVYVDRVEAKWPLGLRFEAGSRVPAHCTAIGKLLLSRLPERERGSIVGALPLTRYTSRTITNPDSLDAELARMASSDISVDNGEFIDGVVCVAVPVIGAKGRVIGGIAVSAPEARISLDQALRFVPAMRTAAERLAATFDKAS